MRMRMAMVSAEGDARAPTGTVVPLLRPQTGSPPAIAGIDRTMRPAPLPAAQMSRTQAALFVGLSLALHAGAFAAFQREAPPLASVGVQSISVELELGTDRLAGRSMKPVVAESTVDAVAAKGEAAQLVKPETARAEVKVVEPIQRARPDRVAEVQPQPRVQAPAEAKPVERQQTAALPVLAANTPSSDTAMPLPEAEQPVAEQPSAVAALPDATVEMPRPRPEPPRTVEKPPEPRNVTEPPKRKAAVRQKNDKGEDARARESANSSASVASSGIGRGRSDAVSNYSGLVQAQLRRNLHFPPDAKRNGQEGRAVVRFIIEPSGSASNIVLAHGTGIASLDSEAQAVVRRASPFPPPPSGRREPFRVPLTFDIR
jgi:TonB family protein